MITEDKNMADDTTTTTPVVDISNIPSIGQVIDAVKVTPEQLKEEESAVITGALNDLVSGKNPLKSKTLVINGILFIVGMIGSIGTALYAGDVQSIMPFLVIMGSGAVNTVLRFFTTGPILTQAMQKLMEAYANTKTPSTK
jgi:hypothetical protein